MAHQILQQDSMLKNKVNNLQAKVQSFAVDGMGRRCARRRCRPGKARHVQRSLAFIRRESGAVAPRANEPAGLDRGRGNLYRPRREGRSWWRARSCLGAGRGWC